VTAASSATFTIKGSLTLTSPNTGEIWIAGSSQNITWTKTGTIANVKLEYSTDGARPIPTDYVLDRGGSRNVRVDGPRSGLHNVKVRVTNTADTTVSDDSNAAFTIKGGLTVTSPVGTDVWNVGAVKTISWTRREPGRSDGQSRILEERALHRHRGDHHRRGQRPTAGATRGPWRTPSPARSRSGEAPHGRDRLGRSAAFSIKGSLASPRRWAARSGGGRNPEHHLDVGRHARRREA